MTSSERVKQLLAETKRQVGRLTKILKDNFKILKERIICVVGPGHALKGPTPNPVGVGHDEPFHGVVHHTRLTQPSNVINQSILIKTIN
jgi:hypothetical protein